MKKQAARGKSDWEMLQWIQKNAKHKHCDLIIAAWTAQQEQRVPTDVESRKFMNEYHSALAPHREDIANWFDVLDIDDFVTFGGKA